MRLFSDKKRPVHLGPYPLESLARQHEHPDLHTVPPYQPLRFYQANAPHSIVNAMSEHQAMLDAIRHGVVNSVAAQCPDDARVRAEHLKAFGYFSDAAMVGVCRLPASARLAEPVTNPDIARLAHQLQTRQTRTLASGIDMIMADLRESMQSDCPDMLGHTHALVFVYEHPRKPEIDEEGAAWIQHSLQHRACLLASETAVVLANYLRLLGYPALAHTGTTSNVDLNQLAVAAGLATVENGTLTCPFIGSQFGLGAVTTGFVMAADKPLAGQHRQSATSVTAKTARRTPYAKRRFVDGAYPFETLKRVDKPTTFIDELRIPRVPKRTDMFARAQFGDMGKSVQAGATGGQYVRKSAPAMAQRRALGAFVLLQDGEAAAERTALDPREAAALIKATSYFLGIDAVGISRCPDWAWYSHDAAGDVLEPPHDQAVSLIVDQGYSTMEGSSGDDWISVALSMRAYLRFSLLGGVLARQIRNLGYPAKAHTVMDGEVLQPPLLLLSGLGEVSRIGEVVLNPFLGPRLKSGVVTTTLPLEHDKPIDFGLQRFCESCNKCARECPSGAITAGPKLMFNGYEIWKSDSQKCATYRITTPGGAMCGRCMKTCPWNLEGVLADSVFRWTAMTLPGSAKLLARLDDWADRGSLNPVKKWWWDLEVNDEGGYSAAKAPVNERKLQKDLHLKYEDQTLAVYPAPLAPHPYPYPHPMDRDKGIEAYQALITADHYQVALKAGEVDRVSHVYRQLEDSPVMALCISAVTRQTDLITCYELRALDDSDLPPWNAGAHVDIVVAPEYLRPFSLCGDPSDRSVYKLAVLKEAHGRGGSALMHRIFTKGRKVFVSKPVNHFPLNESASYSYLMAGGIGITPMIAMAHRLHAIGSRFELHYSGRTAASLALLSELASAPWSACVYKHVSSEGSRLELDQFFNVRPSGSHVYTCGSDAYMAAVLSAARQAGISEDALHSEYFSVPEQPDYENHDFTLKLASSGRLLAVPASKSAAEVLQENGVQVDIKCADGLCGVCQCGYLSGTVEHRDFVLSRQQREHKIILCQSRASVAGGVVELDC